MKKHKVKIPKGYEFDKEIEIDSINKNIPKESKVIGIVFKPIKKELPKTWEELGTINGYWIDGDSDIEKTSGYTDCIRRNKDVWPTKELAEAALALSQLLQLRYRYNEGKEMPCYLHGFSSIYKDEVDDIVLEEDCERGPLKFITRDIGLKFWYAFTDLLETAKPLL